MIYADLLRKKIIIYDYNYEIISDEYTDIILLENSYLAKQKNNKWTILDKNFTKNIYNEYDFIIPYSFQGEIYICKENNKCTILDSNYNPIGDEYDNVYYSLEINNKEGLLYEFWEFNCVVTDDFYEEDIN